MIIRANRYLHCFRHLSECRILHGALIRRSTFSNFITIQCKTDCRYYLKKHIKFSSVHLFYIKKKEHEYFQTHEKNKKSDRVVRLEASFQQVSVL